MSWFFHYTKLLQEDVEYWDSLPSIEREIILNAVSSPQKWKDFLQLTSSSETPNNSPFTVSPENLGRVSEEVNLRSHFRARSIICNRILDRTCLVSRKNVLLDDQWIEDPNCMEDSSLNVSSSIQEFELLDNDKNSEAFHANSSLQNQSISIKVDNAEKGANVETSFKNLSIGCESISQNLMMKAICVLLQRHGVDIFESSQIIHVITDLVIQFLNFFGKIVRRELDIPGKIGNQNLILKASIFSTIDICFGNGIYDVVEYALETGSSVLDLWATQFQHLIPYKANKNKLNHILVEPMNQDEDQPPRQWAVYGNHIPFVKYNHQAMKSQMIFYDLTTTHT